MPKKHEITIEQLKAYLARPVEEDGVDFKLKADFSTAKGKAELVKDIAAMSNNKDGGILVIGVDGDKCLGIPELEHDRYDSAKLHDLVKDKLSPVPTIVSERIEHEAKWFFFIFISQPEESIVIVTKDLSDGSRSIVSAGNILFRKNTQSVPVTSESDLRKMIDAIVLTKVEREFGRHNAVQEQMSSLIAKMSEALDNGTFGGALTIEDPLKFQAELLAKLSEIDDAKVGIGVDRPSWHISFVPMVPGEHELSAIRQAYGQTIEFGGDNFPLLGVFSNFCKVSRIKEGYVAISELEKNWKEISAFGLNGGFEYRATLIEDYLARSSETLKNSINVQASIRKITFSVIYAFYAIQSLGDQGTWKIQINLLNVSGRKLSAEMGVWFQMVPKSILEKKVLLEKEVSIADKNLIPNIVADLCMELFSRFNWSHTDSNKTVITTIQEMMSGTRKQDTKFWFA